MTNIEAYFIVMEVLDAEYFQDSPFRQAVEMFLDDSPIAQEVKRYERTIQKAVTPTGIGA